MPSMGIAAPRWACVVPEISRAIEHLGHQADGISNNGAGLHPIAGYGLNSMVRVRREWHRAAVRLATR
jgi:hypothetical protein